MNRATLSEATSLHDAPVPIYLMQEIANGSKASPREAEKIAEFLLRRLSKSNLNVKLKALQIISFCIREGGASFSDAVKEKEHEIENYTGYTGPPDPVYGDEKYRRIRVAAQDVLVCLHDGSLPRREGRGPVSTWGSISESRYSPTHQQQPFRDSYNQPASSGQIPAPYRENIGTQHVLGSGNSSHAPPAPYSDQLPYRDNPSQYDQNGLPGDSQQGYNGRPQPGLNAQPSFGEANSVPNTYGAPSNSYGGSHSIQQQSHGGNDHGSTSSGWNASAPGRFIPPSNTSSGTWSSSGYQKKEAADQGFYPSKYSKDNRPTVLVGHSVNFPQPASSGFGGNTFGNASKLPSYIENTNRIMSGVTQGLHMPVHMSTDSSGPTSKFGKTVQELKKKSLDVKEKWERRNMDKSMSSALAEHDDYISGLNVVDRGYYKPQVSQQTGGGDTSGDYERGLIDNLCAPAGLAKTPPADALQRFLELAKNLDAISVVDIIFDKMEDESWQVRLKALYVVQALLEASGCDHYLEHLEENVELFQGLINDPKPSVASKALEVSKALGLADESEQVTSAKIVSRSGSSVATVDMLGFDSLSIQPTQSAQVQHQNTSYPSQRTTIVEKNNSNSKYVYSQQRQEFPAEEERARSLSNLGKDLFTIANSPRNAAPLSSSSQTTAASQEKSAFSFI